MKKDKGQYFTEMFSLSAQGFAKYFLQDIAPFIGRNTYRIKSVDKDGKNTYSNAVSIMVKEGNLLPSVYPNPSTNGHFTVDMKHAVAQPVDYLIFDTQGKK